MRNRNKFCAKCGSGNLISDRSLGGKIICVRCGSSLIRTSTLINSSNRNFYFLSISLIVVLLIIFL